MPGSDFDRQLQLLERYQRSGDWDAYFALAASPRFQEEHAAWTARRGAAGATGPLGVLGFALGQAVRLGRIGDAAALTLAHARWTRRLSIRDPLGARGGAPGGPGRGAGEAGVRTGTDVLRALLRAWELFDDGNPGAARSLLADIVRGSPPLIRTSDGARWAVPLLGQALAIAPDTGPRLLGLVDDNVLGDLARALTTAGAYTRALIAGSAMRLFHETKADILADLALVQAEAALKRPAAGSLPGEPAEQPELRAVAEIANLAAAAARRAREEGAGATMAPRVPQVAGRLAKAAAALTLSGEHALAAQRWAEAMAAAEQEPDPHGVLADLAKAQVRAGLLDAAAQVIGVLLDQARPEAADWQANAALDPAWQAAAALVAALAERGDVNRAAAVLRTIPDFAQSHPRAVRALARAVAAADVAAAERLAGQVRNPDGRGYALAAVAAAALSAGQQHAAVRVAAAIEHPRWRAQALVDLAGAPGQAAEIPFDEVRGAIAALADPEDSAVLLAEYAVTRDTADRQRLLGQARRLAAEAPADARWRVLANIGAAAAEAGLDADAREAFTAATRLLARKPREWDLELYQLCLARLNAGDAAGARETAAVALGARAGRKGVVTALASRTARRQSVAGNALDSLVTAAEAADGPVAVAALAAIACAIGEAARLTASSPAASLPPEAATRSKRVLAEAERLANGLRGAGRIAADESLMQAYTALGEFAAAERRILGLLPPPDPGDEDASAGANGMAEDGVVESGDGDAVVAAARERGVALSDALVAAGKHEHAAAFMHEVAGRLTPCAWGLGPAAPDLLAELAAAQVRTGDIAGARATAAFAATVAQGMAGAFRLPEPFGSPVDDWAGDVAAVVDAMTALIREAGVGPAEFAGASQQAIDYARRPWQARAHTLAARAPTCAGPAERAQLAGEQERIWRLATATPVRGATFDLDDAVRGLAVLAAAQAAAGDLSGARKAIVRARELAADIEDRAERARALAAVVEGLSAIGDHAAAVSAARSVGHPAYEEQAVAGAVAAAARAGVGLAGHAADFDLPSAARAIGDPGWRAVALAAVAFAVSGPLSLDEVNELAREVPDGDPRTRVWREVIGCCLATGRYSLAVDLAAEITGDASVHLTVIAVELGVSAAGNSAGAGTTTAGREEARTALLRLLPRCARYPEAGYAACLALAVAFPADADAVAAAVTRHAAALTAATGDRSRG